METDANNAEHYADRANEYFQLKDCPNAIKDATKSIEYNENSMKGYSIRAMTYMSLDQHDLALGDYKMIHQLKPSQENKTKIEIVKCIIQMIQSSRFK